MGQESKTWTRWRMCITLEGPRKQDRISLYFFKESTNLERETFHSSFSGTLQAEDLSNSARTGKWLGWTFKCSRGGFNSYVRKTKRTPQDIDLLKESRNLVRRRKKKLRGPRLEKWTERGMKGRGRGIWENPSKNLPQMREEIRLASEDYPKWVVMKATGG